jgi:hypothetical protein
MTRKPQGATTMTTQSKLDFLTDRAATLGGKLALMLEQGRIPSDGEVKFFNSSVDALMSAAPSHEMRVLAMRLNGQVVKAKADRAAWLSGRDQRAKDFAAFRRETKKAKMSKKVFRTLVDEVKARTALPKGVTSQGLPFVAELPAEWQSSEVVA